MPKLVFLLNGFLIFLIVQLHCSNVIALYSHNIYHRYSDKVVGVLGSAGLPKRGTTEYYRVWSAYDQHRQLSATQQHLPALTFAGGGDVTTRIDNLGHLHYAEIYVGAPPVSFLVALDTGSVISWLPCGCKDCARSFTTSKGEKINPNSYSPHSSSTSEVVFCNSPDCWPEKHCPLIALKPCSYEVKYLSKNTSTKGILVKDTMHLETYDSKSKPIGAPVVFGCGEVETGDLLDLASINGLLGLGHAKLDVTNLLSSNGFVRNSFSLCFTSNGSGRIAFGDKGDADQMTTPLDTPHESMSYNIRIEQISVENVVTNVEFAAVFDSGTTVTHLTEELYSLVTKYLDSFVKDPRILIPQVPLEYCYTTETSNTSYWTPSLNLKTKGGSDFHVINPTLKLNSKISTQIYYCLGILKDNRVNIIGQNFMTGYHLVFDREKLVLGWKPSNCQAKEANTIASSEASLPILMSISFFIVVSISISFIIM